MNDDLTKRKLLSALCHGSIFFSATLVSVGIPLVIFLVSDDEIAKESAKESLNFHFNIWLYGVIATILTFILIGWLLLPIVALFNFVMPIIAIISAWNNPNKVYRYPFIFRLL